MLHPVASGLRTKARAPDGRPGSTPGRPSRVCAQPLPGNRARMLATSLTIDGTVFFSCLLAVLAALVVVWLLSAAGFPWRR